MKKAEVEIFNKLYTLEYILRNTDPNYLQKMEGTFASGLHHLDDCLKECKNNSCHFVINKNYELWDSLSLDKCMTIKAYHVWRAKGAMFQCDRRDVNKDNEEAWQEFWVPARATCPDNCRINAISDIKAKYSYATNLENRKLEVAYWLHLSAPQQSAEYNYGKAERYLSEFNNKLNITTIAAPDSHAVKNFIYDNAVMMSVTEGFALSCLYQL